MREVDPKHTKRARAFDLWMQAPMPMVTLFYTLEVSNLRWASRKHGYPFNMLLCWCIGRAAARMGSTLFFAPWTDRQPSRGRPPSIR